MLRERETDTINLRPDFVIRKDNTVDQIREILRHKESAVLLALPAFHREQKIFGKVENQKRETFIRNTAFDLSSFEQVPNAEETAMVAFNALKQAEFILHWDFIDNSKYLMKNGPDQEKEISNREKIITHTIWRNLNPDKFDPKHDLAANLTYQFIGNLRYYLLYGPHIRKTERTSVLSEDDDYSGDRRVRRLSSPSAESVYIGMEEQTEFNRLISQVSPILLRHISTLSAEPTSYRTSNIIVPTESERVALFTKYSTGLTEIMSVIDSLPDLQKKCILFYFGYLGNNLSQEEWTTKEKISEQLLRSTLHKVFDAFENDLGHPQPHQHSIKEIVHSCKYYQGIRSSHGWTQNESSRPLKIIKLTKYGLHIGSLTRNEFLVTANINSHFQKTHTVPNYSDISQDTNLPETTVEGLVTSLANTNPLESRFATGKHRILPHSAHYEAIKWYRENQNNPNAMKRVSGFKPLHRQVFLLSVTLEGNYYRTPEQISEALKPFTKNVQKLSEHIPDIMLACMKKLSIKSKLLP
jgi:hypothetical protein